MLLIILNIILCLSAISHSTQDKLINRDENIVKLTEGNQKLHVDSKKHYAVANFTFIEKENPLRMPSKFYESVNNKPKPKKSPKRTIQKIIRKGKSKTRRIFVNSATRTPTQETEYPRIQDNDYTKSIEDVPTTEVNRRKRFRKKSKVARYPMPFHKMLPKKDTNGHNRNKRETERDDLYILKDLDEIEFLSRENDYNIVRAHVKNYW